MGGISRSSTSEVTMRPKAAPRTTATASSSTLPRRMNSAELFPHAPILRPGLAPVGPRVSLLTACEEAAGAKLAARRVALGRPRGRGRRRATPSPPPTPSSGSRRAPTASSPTGRRSSTTSGASTPPRRGCASRRSGRPPRAGPSWSSPSPPRPTWRAWRRSGRDNLRLADPRGLSPEEADAPRSRRGKTIVALNHGIHSTEVAATQTAMETAYRLATGEDAGDARGSWTRRWC